MRMLLCFFAGLFLPTSVLLSDDPGEARQGVPVYNSPLGTRIDQSIDRARKYLYAQQNPDGSWTNGDRADADGGRTSIVLLALLSAGEPADSEVVTRALGFLRNVRSRTTYGTSLRAAALSLLPERLRRAELPFDLRWLLGAQINRGADRGLYTYGDRIEGNGDYSNSQYGVLGVWYAADAGLEVPAAFWRDTEAAWRRGQRADGSFGYTPTSSRGYASMTAAGAATLAITEEFLHVQRASDLNRLRPNQPLEDALHWLGENLAADANTGRGNQWVHYMLFGVERVGEATGFTRFGDKQWFEMGAEYLLRDQLPDGSWNGSCGPHADTAYALLFLARGQAPVAVQKLQWGWRWNNRPLDARRISRHIRTTFERLVNWQVLSIDSPLDEWRQSPILYIASDRLFEPTDEQKQKLRAYVEQGGLILAVNEGGRDDFNRSVERLATELWPTYELRPLPVTSPILRGNFDATQLGSNIQSVNNGVRELLVLVRDTDISWKWHAKVDTPRPGQSPWALVGNVWLYATDAIPPARKTETTWIDAPGAVRGLPTARVARLRYQGNWNPEPAGWTRLSNLLATERVATLSVDEVAIAGGLDAARHPIAHLTGTTEFALEQAERDALKRYLDAGGQLVIDAAGGTVPFAVSAERTMSQLYPAGRLAPLPLDHPVYRAGKPGMQKLDLVGYRRKAVEAMRYINQPRLKGFTVDGRVVAILSSEDLSAGLAGYARDGIIGYTPASSTRLMTNILLHAAK